MASKKKSGAIEEPENKASRFVAFNSVDVKGDQANIRVDKKNMVLSSQVMLFLQSILWQKAAELSIKKITCIWCPMVEPGTAASINVSVSYNISDETDDINAEETMLSTTGVISETLRLDVFPTQPILKKASDAFYIPWSATAEIPDTLSNANNCVLGVLKMWCYLKIKTYFSNRRPERKMYKEPMVTWSNVHYPYYIPFYIMKKVRGLHSVLWRDTAQFKKFTGQVGAHLDEKITPETKYLAIMQILSKDDASAIAEMTSSCHKNSGGFCTCGDKVDKFIASAMANNHGRCTNHGTIFDRTGRDIMIGNIKMINGHPEIKF